MPLKLDLRLDWSEMDLFGHVNNVMFFKYIQASRVNYWETIGLTDRFEETRIGPILASTSCKFIKPLHYPGNIRVEATVEFIKNTSFGVLHRIFNQENELVAEAEDIIVMYDFSKNSKVTFPGEMRRKVEEIEKKTF